MTNLTKKLFAAAVIGASALMMTACAKKTDLFARYPKIVKHCFGEDCKLTYIRSTKLSAYTTDDYRLEYKDHTGKTRVYSEDHFSIIPYDKETDADDYTEEEYYLGELELLAEEQLSTVFSDELFEQMIRSDIPSAYPDGKYIKLGAGGMDGNMLFGIGMLGSVCADDPEFQALGKEMLDADNGIAVCKADLNSIAQDERIRCMISVTLTEGADTAEYQKAFDAFLADFRKIGPVNYTFVLRGKKAAEDGTINTSVILREDCILGEQIDAEARRAAWTYDGDYSIQADTTYSLIEKRKQS